VTTNVSWMPPRWLAVTFAVLIALSVGYWAWWRSAAGILQEALNGFRQGGAGQGVTASWDAMSVSGFPLRLRATLDNPRYENQQGRLTWAAKGLTVETLPWSVSQFTLAAHGPQKIQLGPALTVAGEAKDSGVSLLFRDDGLPKQLDVAARGADATIQGPNGDPIRIKGEILAAHWRIDPDDANLSDGRDYDAAVNGTNVTLTGVELPFGPDVGDLKILLTLRGVPALQGVDGAMDLPAWRQRGARVTVRKLSFVSGGVDVQGAGDVALDANGVAQGELALTVGGFDKIVDLLSRRGAIPAEAKTTLFVTSTMLSATGAKVPLPLVFKDGRTYLGPAQIGPAPRLVF
jgi:hypothetical protein